MTHSRFPKVVYWLLAIQLFLQPLLFAFGQTDRASAAGVPVEVENAAEKISQSSNSIAENFSKLFTAKVPLPEAKTNRDSSRMLVTHTDLRTDAFAGLVQTAVLTATLESASSQNFSYIYSNRDSFQNCQEKLA